MRTTATALLVVLMWPAAASADVVESTEQEYYTARPVPGQSLREALDAVTPIEQDGRVFHGHTRWEVAWSFHWWEEADGRCRITSNRTTLSLVFTMPRLADEIGPVTRARFNHYYEQLERHELGHARIAREAAYAIDRTLLALPAMKSCAALEATAHRRARALLAEAETRQRDHDRSTDHGAREGARLD